MATRTKPNVNEYANAIIYDFILKKTNHIKDKMRNEEA